MYEHGGWSALFLEQSDTAASVAKSEGKAKRDAIEKAQMEKWIAENQMRLGSMNKDERAQATADQKAIEEQSAISKTSSFKVYGDSLESIDGEERPDVDKLQAELDIANKQIEEGGAYIDALEEHLIAMWVDPEVIKLKMQAAA